MKPLKARPLRGGRANRDPPGAGPGESTLAIRITMLTRGQEGSGEDAMMKGNERGLGRVTSQQSRELKGGERHREYQEMKCENIKGL